MLKKEKRLAKIAAKGGGLESGGVNVKSAASVGSMLVVRRPCNGM